MPKKNPPTAFMMFVMKRKREMGEDAAKWTTPEAVTNLGPEWEALSKEEKEPYQQKVKAMKAQAREQQAMADPWPADSTGNEDCAPGSICGIPG